jgi:sulfide:quinone oxidoreductase
VVIAVCGTPYKCPPAPLEQALVLEWHLTRRGVSADIHVYIPEPVPLGVAGPDAARRVTELLSSRGITLHTQITVTAVDPSGKRASFSDGTSTEAELLILVPVHRVPQVVAESGLTQGKPWVPVDPQTLETRAADNVFAVGDVNSVPIGADRGIPKAGVFASGQGRHAARVIASRITGSPPPPPYEGAGSCLLLFSGEEVAEVGGVFLTPDGPRVGLGEPQPLSAKAAWEADWQAFRI